MALSEFRAYGYILDMLEEMGWDRRPPSKGGQVFAQQEILADERLKAAFGLKRPENVVAVSSNEFWVIEAKAEASDLSLAVSEAQERAAVINAEPGISCRIATGVAGTPESTHYVETHCLVDNSWQPLTINDRRSTGFISPEQTRRVLSTGTANLSSYEIDDDLFRAKTSRINDILHSGGINKRNRAGVLACLLLALAQEERMQLNDDPTTLIKDINARAKRMLEKYNKAPFYTEIEINLPTSTDNHVKHRNALKMTIEAMRDLNIASAINSGRDVLGQFYERFLTYANDAKELGIVLTPRHITNFAAEVTDVRPEDVVFDPACGTGGFLVAALDRVRRRKGSEDPTTSGNLHGIEQDPLIATLAIVNMIFRGDGSSNINEGNGLVKKIDVSPRKVLMNPPFAHKEEYEWRFVDRGLKEVEPHGLLFSVLPITSMSSADDERSERTWRRQLLQRHTLVAVIKLPEDLFYPHVSKGTYAVIIRAHRPHEFASDNVVWAVLHDGVVRTKTSTPTPSNMATLQGAIGNFIATGSAPAYVPQQIDCRPIELDDNSDFDLSPERHIGRSSGVARVDVDAVKRSMADARSRMQRPAEEADVDGCHTFRLIELVEWHEKGKSGRAKDLPVGTLPLISTSEKNNGISTLVDRAAVNKIYDAGLLTVSANGSSCVAFLHDYEFAANGDVHVLSLKDEFASDDFAVWLCAAINSEGWRYNYFRKLSVAQLHALAVQVPVNDDGTVDFARISELVRGG